MTNRQSQAIMNLRAESHSLRQVIRAALRQANTTAEAVEALALTINQPPEIRPETAAELPPETFVQ
jgi:hypothetical protein